ncbi:MAG: PhzF family phenazine biosynthesis isomerase, partial [Gammaproteobacteria bacterium]|nr:PhzF family phenazine biosynthesis isomerase [Gammaproteobacteria bacterium]
VGQIPVELIYRNGVLSDLWMNQKSPDFGKTLTPDDITPILNIDEQDIDSRFPIQEVSTGLPFFIVPLKTLCAVQRAKINQESYYNFVRKHNPKLESADSDNVISSAFFIFTQETQDNTNDIHARMFDDYYGVPEDPATGSANGCLLAYLLKYNYFGKKELELRVEQGYEMKRPSLLKITGRLKGEEEIDIFVGGQVQMVAKGEWHR